MKRFAVIMATEQYADPSYTPTPYCHNDARLLRDTLVDFCDYAEQDILLELLEPETPISPSDLLARIEEIGKRSQPGDTILFFYAGHGGLFEGDAYLILSSTRANNKTQSAVPFRDVATALRIAGRTNVRIFDTCHSGVDVREVADASFNQRDSALDVNGLARAVATGTEEGWITFAACKEFESSHADPAKRQGIFTWALCEAIKELSPEQDVYPELLKVSLCKRVKEWADTSRLAQTPAFNSAVSGNVTIARRKSLRQTSLASGPPTAEPTASVDERLARLRALLRPGTRGHTQALADSIGSLKGHVEASVQSLRTFGISPTLSGPSRAYELPEELHRHVVRFVESKKWRPLHEVESRQVTQERPATLFEKVSGHYGSVSTTNTEFTVSQSSDLPDSLVYLKIDSDGVVPNALLFFYLLPLQVRAAFLLGIAFSSEMNFSDKRWRLQRLEDWVLDISSDNKEAIAHFAAHGVARFESYLVRSIDSRLKVLEEELAMSTDEPKRA